MSVARYVIVLDRYDDDDYAADQMPEGGHDGTEEGGCRQVAAELQEAMTELGTPAGFFQVIAREFYPTNRPNGEEANVGSIDADANELRESTAAMLVRERNQA